MLLCCGPLLLAQPQATASTQTQSQTASVAQTQATKPATGPVQYDPTKPEVQRNLSVDRDPVLSPDPEDNLPVGATVPPPVTKGPAGEIQKGQGGIYTLYEDVNEVVLNCTVVDEKKELVRDLKKSDFRVWEDGVPQAINSFQYQDLPVSLGILIDNSGSMHDKRAAVNAAALELMRASNPADETFIVNFSDKAYLDQGFTSNISLLERGLARFDSKNTTAMYDAVAASADELTKQAKQPKQVLLIITDGADNASRLSLGQAAARVQRLGGPVVYSIGLLFGDDPKDAERARGDLERLSEETGGIAYFPRSLDDVNEIAGEVARDIREQYTIGYHSTREASLGGYRTVRVEATAPHYKRLTVRTRRGYYPRTARPVPRQTAETAR